MANLNHIYFLNPLLRVVTLNTVTAVPNRHDFLSLATPIQSLRHLVLHILQARARFRSVVCSRSKINRDILCWPVGCWHRLTEILYLQHHLSNGNQHHSFSIRASCFCRWLCNVIQQKQFLISVQVLHSGHTGATYQGMAVCCNTCNTLQSQDSVLAWAGHGNSLKKHRCVSHRRKKCINTRVSDSYLLVAAFFPHSANYEALQSLSGSRQGPCQCPRPSRMCLVAALVPAFS